MTLSDLSVRRPVFTWMMMLALGVFGVLGYLRLGVDQFPSMDYPMVTVEAQLDGGTPEGLEEDVTDVLEEELTTISGVKSIRSVSAAEAVQITVEFELGTDPNDAANEVREKVASARRRLPREVEPPTVEKFDFSSQPVLFVPFYSQRPLVQTSEYVRRQVKPLLETIPGVAHVQIFGEEERNIRIWVNEKSLRARGLAANDLLEALRREHIERPAGFVEGRRIEWSVKTDAEFASVREMQNMLIAYEDGGPVYLRDVAWVEDGVEDIRTLTRMNGVPGLALSVAKESDGNAVAIVDEVLRRLDEVRSRLPDGIEMAPVAGFIDMTRFVRESIEETLFALLFGGVLAVFVVFVFLRRSRPTLIIAAAIPMSLITTFGLIWVFDYTLNTMTLLGLNLAIGVVIDDAIIVLENIERHREMGKSGREAALDGTRQITFAATAATISVAVVFLPVVFASGQTGSFMAEFGLTVAGSVVISLFVALTLTPMLAARMPPPAPRGQRSIYQQLERGFGALESGYRQVLYWSLRHRALTLSFAVGSLGLAVFFGSRLGTEFFPDSDSGLLYGEIETAPGSSLETISDMMAHSEDFFLGIPETVTVFARAGGGNSMTVGSTNKGAISVSLLPGDQRERTLDEINREARQVLSAIPGQKVMFGGMSGTTSRALEVVLKGNLPLADLDRYADRMIAELRSRSGYVDLDKSLKLGLPELRVVPDREKAAALGVGADTLAEIVQVMIGGLDVGVFKEEGRRYDIRVRTEREERSSPAAIQALSVRARDGRLVELRNLVSLERGAAPSEITRRDRQRSVIVGANLDGKVLGDAVAEVETIAAGILPDELTLGYDGFAEQMQESGGQFGLMLLLAVLVIYMVLAAQFESFSQPLAVMLALPFAMIGALGGLWLMDMTLNMFSMIGIILLIGLVTKNSILLVDYANQLRDEGLSPLEAIRKAAPVRMRPVLMTALSMIFGVLPSALGIGPGSESRAPMAVATAAGMLTSMLLTLLVVPVFYLVLQGRAKRPDRPETPLSPDLEPSRSRA